MKRLLGRPVSPGYATGSAVLHDRTSEIDVPRHEIQSDFIQAEQQRFQDAVDRTHHDLKQLEQRVLAELGQAPSEIFSSHLGLLRDKKFIRKVSDGIRDSLINAEQALESEVTELAKSLSSNDNEYIRERAGDVRDVGHRLMRHLLDAQIPHTREVPPNSVLVAHELFPSETIDLEHITAIVTEEGGENSHAAILARAQGIPAVTGIDDATTVIENGAQVLVDGEFGNVTIMPTDTASHDFAAQRHNYEESMSAAVEGESLECATLDGTEISLLANINRSSDASFVDSHNLDGIGLCRTEFLYMDCPEPPSFEHQRDVYRSMSEAIDGRPVVIRTLDLGGDKFPAFLSHQHEANPHLGLRGLRFSLAERDLFETQLRAILTANELGNIRVLFPMVRGVSDLQSGLERVREIASDSDTVRLPEIGAMIETPSALFVLDEILEIVDFVSIGTNDLTQFMLAADRDATRLVDDYSVLHPSVLRAISKVIQACESANCELCICGEAAGYVRTACLLVGLGARQLSMSPIRSARVRLALRTCHDDKLQSLAYDALRCKTTSDVRNLLIQFRPHDS